MNIEGFDNINFVEILKLGVIGLAFLLSLLSFLLLRNEQKRPHEVRKNMIKAIYFFMISSFVILLLNASIEIFKMSCNSESSKELNEKLKKYEQKWTINGKLKIGFDSGGRDLVIYAIPSFNFTPYYIDENTTGINIVNFQPTIAGDNIQFPSIGFRSKNYVSKGTYSIQRGIDAINDSLFTITLRDTIFFAKKTLRGE